MGTFFVISDFLFEGIWAVSITICFERRPQTAPLPAARFRTISNRPSGKTWSRPSTACTPSWCQIQSTTVDKGRSGRRVSSIAPSSIVENARCTTQTGAHPHIQGNGLSPMLILAHTASRNRSGLVPQSRHRNWNVRRCRAAAVHINGLGIFTSKWITIIVRGK